MCNTHRTPLIFYKTLSQILWQGRPRACSFFSGKLKAKNCKTLAFATYFGLLSIPYNCSTYSLIFVLLPFRKRLMVLVLVLYVSIWYVSTLSSAEFIKNDQSIISKSYHVLVILDKLHLLRIAFTVKKPKPV